MILLALILLLVGVIGIAFCQELSDRWWPPTPDELAKLESEEQEDESRPTEGQDCEYSEFSGIDEEEQKQEQQKDAKRSQFLGIVFALIVSSTRRCHINYGHRLALQVDQCLSPCSTSRMPTLD